MCYVNVIRLSLKITYLTENQIRYGLLDVKRKLALPNVPMPIAFILTNEMTNQFRTNRIQMMRRERRHSKTNHLVNGMIIIVVRSDLLIATKLIVCLLNVFRVLSSSTPIYLYAFQ